jgi:hypothetical protein
MTQQGAWVSNERLAEPFGHTRVAGRNIGRFSRNSGGTLGMRCG